MIMGTTRCHVFSRHPPKNMITGNNWTLFNASTVNALLKDLRGEGKMTNLRSVPTSVHHTECGFKNIHDTTQKDRQKAKRKRMKRIQPAGGEARPPWHWLPQVFTCVPKTSLVSTGNVIRSTSMWLAEWHTVFSKDKPIQTGKRF